MAGEEAGGEDNTAAPPASAAPRPGRPAVLGRRLLDPRETAARGLALEEWHLRFANGVERRYRRLRLRDTQVVLVVPLLDPETVLLVREYAVGPDACLLQLPKGRIEAGEDPLAAADRELKEEIGKGARRLTAVNRFTALPGYLAQTTEIILAEDLYDERLPGDEPEPLEVVPWNMNRLYELASRPDCSEARTLAALYFVRDWLARRSPEHGRR